MYSVISIQLDKKYPERRLVLKNTTWNLPESSGEGDLW
jgi:hypothetical protein